MLPKTTISFTSKIIAITVKQVVIIAATLVLSPSIPSVKFTAFVVPNYYKYGKWYIYQTGKVLLFLRMV